MAFITYHDVGITAVSACVPKNIISNYELGHLIPPEEIEKTINSIGIKEKRFVDKDVCSSDLCYRAAEQLIQDNHLDRTSIDALIFISQTSDYRQPATAPSLQNRLELPQTVMAFDVNLACSGYVYGLSIAYSFCSQKGINKVLLLVGETMSKTISQKDKVTAPLFGDAGTATLIEKVEGYTSFFSLNSDGSGSDILKMPFGGYRNLSCEGGLLEIPDSDGNLLSGEHLHMKGMDVFNFGLRVVPKDIKYLLSTAEVSIADIDILLFHQANRFMTDFFAKKLNIPLEKVPYCLEKFGNTSSASIPLTIVTQLKVSNFVNKEKVVMSGFGAGLSWASSLLSLTRCNISEMIEY